LIEVELGDLKKVEKELADLLRQRLKADVKVKGSKLILDDSNGRLSHKDAKQQVEHALHHLGLGDEYRVHSEHHLILIVKVAKKTRYVEKKGTTPSPNQTMPYFFPG
jgi:hypothetical protein